MNSFRFHMHSAFWLALKDLRCEWRSRRTFPAMALLGGLLVVMVALQLDIPLPLRRGVGGGLFWLTVFFAGTLMLDRTLGAERDEGCYDALRLYPFGSLSIYLAKLAVNFLTVVALEFILAPALVVFADVPLLDRPLPLALIALLANLGFAAVGTVLGAATSGISQRGGLVAVLSLPLLAPVILAASEATRATLAGPADAGWVRPAQLLACFALLFTTLGGLVFAATLED